MSMEIQIVYSARWRVASPVTRDEDGKPKAVLTDFLKGLDANYQRSAEGMLALIKRAADLVNGPLGLGRELCHPVNTAAPSDTIYELIKGDLRVFFFIDGQDRIMVCACGTIKKGRKADPQKVGESKRIRNLYQNAKQAGCLKLSEDEKQ
jgi:hypothetical protein